MSLQPLEHGRDGVQKMSKPSFMLQTVSGDDLGVVDNNVVSKEGVDERSKTEIE
jgi:hypothetical protein